MARFTLSIADDVAAQLDAWAAENNLNRSQAAEHIFRNAFQAPSNQFDDGQAEDGNDELVSVGGELSDQVGELRDYLTILYSRHESLRDYVLATVDHTEAPFGTNYPRALPKPGWLERYQD
jgi:hypothetical protein